MNLQTLREIANAYEQSVRTCADIWRRDLEMEALAAIQGAARCLSGSSERVTDLVREVVEDAELSK